MTKDIVECLRNSLKGSVMWEAAAEIERLRAALYSVNANLDAVGEAYTAAAVETMRNIIDAALAGEKKDAR